MLLNKQLDLDRQDDARIAGCNLNVQLLAGLCHPLVNVWPEHHVYLQLSSLLCQEQISRSIHVGVHLDPFQSFGQTLIVGRERGGIEVESCCPERLS